MSKEKALSLLYLGFDENANPTEEEIHKAYRKTAKILHPDGNGSDEQFRGLTIARDVLLSCVPKKQKEKPKQSTSEFEQAWQERRNKEIKKLEQQICSELSEVLKKLPKRIYCIYIKLFDRSLVSINVSNGEFKTIEIQDSSDSYETRTLLLYKVRLMNDHYTEWEIFKDYDITLKMHSKLKYLIMKLRFEQKRVLAK